MNTVISSIKEKKLIAIIRSTRSNGLQIKDAVKALIDGGVNIVEVTMNTPDALKSIEKLRSSFPDILIGAGTILDGETARMGIVSGANFLLTPTLNRAAIEVANRYSTLIIPGVLTPTEAIQAREWGAQVLKVFPVSSLGAQYIKDLKAPLPHLDFIPVGGVSLQNARAFMDAGSFALGIGSSLVNDKLLYEENYPEITARAKKFVELVS